MSDTPYLVAALTSLLDTTGSGTAGGGRDNRYPVTRNPQGERRYERPARSGRGGRWRPLLELPLFVLLAFMAMTLVAGAGAGLASTADEASTAFRLSWLAQGFGSVAALLVAVSLTVRWVGGRRMGSVSSTVGRLRWRWLCSCLMPAVVLVGLFVAAVVGMAPGPSWNPALWPGWVTYAGLVIVTLLVVPFQAAAEEYVTRGWLVQTLATWTRHRWVAAAPTVVLFIALHGTTDPWAIIDLGVFACVCCWLTFRTGGLEAAIVLHAVTNVVLMLVGGLHGVPDIDAACPELGPVEVLASIATMLLYAWWVAMSAARLLPRSG